SLLDHFGADGPGSATRRRQGQLHDQCVGTLGLIVARSYSQRDESEPAIEPLGAVVLRAHFQAHRFRLIPARLVQQRGEHLRTVAFPAAAGATPMVITVASGPVASPAYPIRRSASVSTT